MRSKITGFDTEGRRHGLWESYYSDGTLGIRRHYHHGTLHGVWEWYRSDGTLRWREHWHHGEQKGLDIRWDTQGGITDKAYNLVIR